MLRRNPLSPYALVKVVMEFQIGKGEHSIIPAGTLGLDDHATITKILADGITLHLPEGVTLIGTEITTEDL